MPVSRKALASWLDEACQGSFSSVVTYLESLLGDAHRVGQDDVNAERIRFRNNASLMSATGDIHSARITAGSPDDPIIEITTSFLGLSGTVSPLPSFMAEEVIREDSDFDARAAFLDLFHHRLLSLLHRLMQSYQGTHALLSLASTARKSLTEVSGGTIGDALPTELIGLCTSRARGPWVVKTAVETMLRKAVASASVEVIPFTGTWHPMGPDARLSLGQRNHRLGDSALLGSHSRQAGRHVTIQIHGVGAVQLARLRPGNDLFQMVRFWMDRASDAPTCFTMEVHINGLEHTRLGGKKNDSRLGVAACLGSGRGQTTFRIDG